MPITTDLRIEAAPVTLRPLQTDDLSALHSTVMADAEVMRYIGSGATSTLEQAEAFLTRIVSSYDDSDFGWFAVTSHADGKLLGVGCLKPLAGELRKAFGEHIEVGYWLAKHAWGQGVATAAAGALLRHGFVNLGVLEVVGVAHIENIASNRVLQKIGLVHRVSVEVSGWPLEFYGLRREEYLSGK